MPQKTLAREGGQALSKEIQDWIGRKMVREDIVTARIFDAFNATLAPHLLAGSNLGVHWCLAPDMVSAEELGADGHPRPGKFLPDVGLPRRMWAGGEITQIGSFGAGDHVRKTSTIIDVSFKSGQSGKLCFVAVSHDYEVDGAVVVSERQDIVYRAAAKLGAAPHPQSPVATGPVNSRISPTSTLLFRYSAMTFNGHRIHYDEAYARGVEGYNGLVVHGPLQATLMLNLAANVSGGVPRSFSYRGVAPLILGETFMIDAKTGPGGIELRCLNTAGDVTMKALAQV